MIDDFYDQKEAVENQPHSCEQCGSVIPAGERHFTVGGAYCGDSFDYRIHVECEAAAKEYAKIHGLRGEDWPWFQHQDDEPEDWRWMLKEHPIVAKRLGWDERLKEWDEDDDEPEAPALLPHDGSTTSVVKDTLTTADTTQEKA